MKKILKLVNVVMLLTILMLSLIGCSKHDDIFQKIYDISVENPSSVNDELNALEVENFNYKFIKYTGESLRSNRVKPLISEIKLNNEEDKIVKIAYVSEINIDNNVLATSDVEKIDGIEDLLSNRNMYKISISKYDEEGYISEITITELGEILK